MHSFRDTLIRTISGSREEKVAGSLELILNAIGFDALVLSGNQKRDRPVLGSIGYSPEIASFLSSEKFESCTAQRMQRRHPNRLFAWEDVNFDETSFAQDVLLPNGYHNGVSVPVLTPAAKPVGMLHCSTSSPSFDKSVCGILLNLQPVLTLLVELSQPTEKSVSLSTREQEIMAHIADGKTNPEIAEDLHLARSTVATHVERILRKIQVTNRVQAAIWWDRHSAAVM